MYMQDGGTQNVLNMENKFKKLNEHLEEIFKEHSEQLM